MSIALTPEPPYYAVIFTSIRKEDSTFYDETAAKMEELVLKQPGYLGHEHAREDIGITVSYWASLQAIKDWKDQTDHQMAQNKGKSDWYRHYKIRICKVEKEYGM
ncbi:antibiotic biosynthesis monooxygenase family protein [Pararhodonellum marinum]|uniref:antibiotic biosynthesis monooxygenase family protein n=1 Tax=Pararhodonellum marinum TaxID=2755358 RepID=UPI00188F0102|nr:antibiotic biosynthesis monooxygenase [Pararhodonellum marinum]